MQSCFVLSYSSKPSPTYVSYDHRNVVNVFSEEVTGMQNPSETNESPEPTKIGKIESNDLDRLIQVLEIAFVFLLTFTLITLVDQVLEGINLYQPLSDSFLGERGVGSLNGGQWEPIVRVTLIFNALLFGFSLTFGLWMRRTRDGWSWSQLGYTLTTPGYTFRDLVRRAILLGLLVIVIYYTLLSGLIFLLKGSVTEIFYFHGFVTSSGEHFSSRQLLAEFYFGVVEMGFIWPLSAGFFFFAYTHNSLNARFPTGVANILSTAFYVFYLIFFFMLFGPGKLTQLETAMTDPIFYGNIIIFLIILYISFSAFAETKSVVLPFLLNFVLNVGLTLFRSINSLAFESGSPLTLGFYLGSVGIVVAWYLVKKSDFSTIRIGFTHLRDKGNLSYKTITLFTLLFLFLAFGIPSIIEQLLYNVNTSYVDTWIVPLSFSLLLAFLILFAMIVLSYEPTQTYDVLLVSKDGGLPIASQLRLFQSDEVLISGFFSALSSFNEELEKGSEVRSIKRGEREIIIEDGVFTRIIALVDKDYDSLRQKISVTHKKFEVQLADKLKKWIGEPLPEGKSYVDAISKMQVTFNLSQQARWISTLALVIAPISILLVGLL